MVLILQADCIWERSGSVVRSSSSRSGHVLLAADYSQMEVRIAAHLSQEPKLCEALCAGGDVFKQVHRSLCDAE